MNAEHLKELFGGEIEMLYEYEPLIDSMPGDVVVQVDQDNTWVLLRDGERWGYLEFGWGSWLADDVKVAADVLMDDSGDRARHALTETEESEDA